ncbi:unnamed protein product [Pleuronectes platessa]|uniref:Uncharacterized protein n=1 Tax=Pleuronectes platessa TaxID=8262 RepID=A0A9N7YCD0_PLEPL|nr:unnamed protein product [Pleuronectes platessa]
MRCELCTAATSFRAAPGSTRLADRLRVCAARPVQDRDGAAAVSGLLGVQSSHTTDGRVHRAPEDFELQWHRARTRHMMRVSAREMCVCALFAVVEPRSAIGSS